MYPILIECILRWMETVHLSIHLSSLPFTYSATFFNWGLLGLPGV